MDFERAADIVNMDLTGRDPGPRGQHMIRYWPTEQADELLHPEVPNEPDLMLEDCWEDDDGMVAYWAPPDAGNESTNTQRDYTLTIAFDAETELQARMLITTMQRVITAGIGGLTDPVFTAELR